MVRIVLFILSTFGLWEAVRRCFIHVDISFVPGLTIAIQTTLLFYAGLLSILPIITFITYGVGFLCLLYFIYRDKNICFIKLYLKPSILFLAIALILFGFFLNGKIFTHYDNFSHWALVIKSIIGTNRFPNAADTIIEFQEYPIGSAIYIYYVAKLTSNAESVQMLAQVFMMLASIIPLFALCKKGWPLVTILIASFSNYVLVYNIAVTDLLVDTLLPLVSMSELIYIYIYQATKSIWQTGTTTDGFLFNANHSNQKFRSILCRLYCIASDNLCIEGY